MTKKIIFTIILSIGVFTLAVTAVMANPFLEIEYPVEELGNCQNREECKLFCDSPENSDACFSFAKQAGLISQEKVDKIERMKDIVGPGGCVGEQECKLYCETIDHMNECIIFAEENGLADGLELEEMKKVAGALKQGIRPPCNSKRECDEICHKPENIEKCMEFEEAAGLGKEHDREESKKFLEAIKNGAIPPDCAGTEECDIYCSQPENMLECTEFALAAGFTKPEEEADMRRSLEAMKQGIMPPDCRGREECDAYCSEPEHVEECMKFSVAAGFMTQDKADAFTKTGGRGPGGCVGESECYEFCGNPNNVEVCLDFSVGIGERTQEEANRIRQEMKEGRGQPNGGQRYCETEEECREFCSKPENFEQCARMGPGETEGMGAGPDYPMGPNDGPKPGPGGCGTPEECEAFCQSPVNAVDCIWMKVGKGEITEEEAKRMEQALMIERGEWGEKNEPIHEGPPPEGEWKEGGFPKDDYQGEFDTQYNEQYNKQFEGQYQDEFQKQYDDQFEGQYDDNRYIPEEHEGEGEWQDFYPKEGSESLESFFSPENVNNMIYDAEKYIREGPTSETGQDNYYPDDQRPQEPTVGEWPEPVPAYDSDYQDSMYREQYPESNYQEPTSGYNEPTYNEPVSESNPQPMPAPEEPVYNEPPPPTYNEPPPPSPESSTDSFIGSIIKFLWGN